MRTYYFAGVLFRVTKGDGTVEMNLVVIPDEFEDGDVEATGQGYPILLNPNGVIFYVLATRRKKRVSAGSRNCYELLNNSTDPHCLWVMSAEKLNDPFL